MAQKMATKAFAAKKAAKLAAPAKRKTFKGYKIMVRSRHPSHKPLRASLSRLPFRSVFRLGSSWAGDGKLRVECNSVDSIKTSADKLLMKQAFAKAGVVTAVWCTAATAQEVLTNLKLKEFVPIVAKHRFGSRGTGNTLITSMAQLQQWMAAHAGHLKSYIFEKFYDYSREYRLHVTKDGCFYTCRKMLKNDVPKDKRWYRNDSNSVWIREENPSFDKPINWKKIVDEACKALTAVGLDVGAIDVRVQSATDKKDKQRTEPQFIILETNSAPSFGEITLQKYLEVVPQILKAKK